MPRFSNNQRSVIGTLLVFCLIVVFIYTFEPFHFRPSKPIAPENAQRAQSYDFSYIHSNDRCNEQPIPPDTVIIVKTGANEVYRKLPTQILTSLRCYKDNNILFFSDLAQQLGPYTIHDALANVSESVKSGNPDFDYYWALKEYDRTGQDISAVGDHNAAWKLDKYKFVHMLEKSWSLRPNQKWYVFIEADTFLVQTNLRLWLERLDSSSPLYFGSPSTFNGVRFAHGGSGFILSGAALSQFVQGDQGVAARYDEAIRNELYGDFVLTKALKEKGIQLKSAWPILNGEKPSTIPFGPGPDTGMRHWCQPIVTMHHMTPSEASQTWMFEQQRLDQTTPILLKELYSGVVAPEMHAERREDWDNLSDDCKYRAPGVKGDRQKPGSEMTVLEQQAHMSFDHCRRACEEQDRCYQFLYLDDQTCGFSYSYRLGRKRLPDGKSYNSGWALARIAEDLSSWPCDVPQWLP